MIRAPDQKFWDAMIIRAWNNFDSCKFLMFQAKLEFGDYPHNLGLIRSTNCFGGVRAWVASELKPLSERLWITPKNKQIELLNWMGTVKLDCSRDKKTQKYGTEARDKVVVSRRRMQQRTVSINLEKSLNKNNSWNVIK
jgi:hypothetical protein